MKILPVLDLLEGVVVRGVAGRRNEYRPVESRLAASADVLTVARAFREQLGIGEFYVADLDAILYDRPSLGIYQKLAAEGFDILVDAGLRSTSRAREVLDAGAVGVIAGLETSAGPRQLKELCDEFGNQRIIFSLDMQAGRPMGDLTTWSSEIPVAIGRDAVEVGIRKMIVLDLAQVGVGQGLTTIELCRSLMAAHPHLEVITGGGVRGADDLQILADAEIYGALVASALHDGRITRADIEQLSS